MQLPKLSTVTRVSLGLASLVVMALLTLDFVFGVIPNPVEQEKRVRQLLSETASVQIALMASRRDADGASIVLRETVKRQSSMKSAALRAHGGHVLASAGEHDALWKPEQGARSSLTHVSVPIVAGGQPWGTFEVVFEPFRSASFFGLVSATEILWPVAVFIVGFALFQLYLRRVLQQLDPSAVVPERVRSAYDVIAEGIVMIDHEARIVLANSAFRAFDAQGGDPLGKRLADQSWLRLAAQSDAALPWDVSLATKEPIERRRMKLHVNGMARTLVVSCTPVKDARGVVRGCLVAFLDRTEVERSNDELQGALQQLQWSTEQIRQKNEELQRLATRDPLTGCHNRRAFFDAAHPLFDRVVASGQRLCCIMIDIDHFKTFNDRYGHVIGDKVLAAVSRKLAAGLREQDLLCRYGGEEFCIVLPECNMEAALHAAERLREAIESHAGDSVRAGEPLRITSSFGVSELSADMSDIEMLIERADKALYRAKAQGRNRVCIDEAWAMQMA
jgi:diguanylate cyclase (GGDEF)-like protein